jgi:hypothetical protein
VEPFQSSAESEVAPDGMTPRPTAIHDVGELHDTPSKLPWLPGPAAPRKTDQLVPFHSSASGADDPALSLVPTATHSEAAGHETPMSPPPDTFGVLCTVQPEPFEISTSGPASGFPLESR